MSKEQDTESSSEQSQAVPLKVEIVSPPPPPPPPQDALQMSSMIKGKDTANRALWWLKGLIDE